MSINSDPFFTGFNGQMNQFTKRTAKVKGPSENDFRKAEARRKIEEIQEQKRLEKEFEL